ncbi:MAG: hypothetical protein ICV54_31230, partial [Nostoc sp. C3-bin3]|nr:hypothetical protein [Nostoc sp. C3-bin3]
MAKAADIGSKRLINLAPDAWVQWVTQRPEVVAKEILGSEFHWISRETDVLVKAYSATQECGLNKVQNWEYNPIEHRLFPHLSRACKGVIFDSVNTVSEFMAKATTHKGLQVFT